MKLKFAIQAAGLGLVLSTLNLQLSTAFAQGSLTPPGPPGPTMLTLTQVEPRTPVDATHTPGDGTSLFIISQPGSYYLTGNIATTTNAIAITTNWVTLDLNGFTISSTASPANGTAIFLAGAADVTVLNGHIKGGVTYNGSSYTGPGFQNGVSYSGASPVDVHISGLSISGCSVYGINLYGAEVDHCTLRDIANTGITAGTINECIVYDSGGSGIIGQTIDNCYGVATSSGYGIFGLTVANSFGASTNYVGVGANVASYCRGETIGGYGFFGDIAIGCYGKSWGSGNALEANFASYCYGFSDSSGYGVGAGEAIGCYGYSSSGIGLIATYGNFSFGTGESVGTKYNMP